MVAGSYLATCISGFILDKFHWAHKIPYLLVHADDPATCAACLAQFDAIPEVDAHRVSVYFCSKVDPTSLRALMDQCVANNVAPQGLQEEVAILNLGRIAEERVSTCGPLTSTFGLSTSPPLRESIHIYSFGLRCFCSHLTRVINRCVGQAFGIDLWLAICLEVP